MIWWALVIGVSTAAATLTDRLARKLLPLAVLLEMTMLFPERAPSRLTVARRAGSPAELRRRIEAAADGGDQDLGEAAGLILSLAAAISHHDRKTRGHVERTRAYTEIIAIEMGLDEADRDRLRWAALLHDVGKLEVPAEILNKDGPLDDDEWQIVRMHPVLGMKLVEPLVPWLGAWAQTIEHHHERWNGTGYPHGLAGTDINLGARIVAVADAYDVMTSGRSYQKRLSPAAARREIVENAGSQFDPAVARALMTVSLGKLRWATGPLAVLAEIPFLGGLERVGRDAITVATSSAVMATALITGAVTLPDIDPEPITRAVLAQAALDPGDGPMVGPSHQEGAPVVIGSDIPLAAEDPTATTTLPAADLESSDPSVTVGDSPPGSAPPVPVPVTSGTAPGTSPSTTASPGSSGSTSAPSTTVPPPSSPTTTTVPPTTTSTPTTTTTTVPPATTATTVPPSTTTTTIPTTTTNPATIVANDDAIVIRADRNWVRISVLRNDEGSLEPSTLRVVVPPAHGQAETRGGSGSIWYRANPRFSGADALTYEICDTSGACAQARVTIDVGG